MGELRTEQGSSSRVEAEKREVEVKVRVLQQHVEEGETEAIKWGEKMVTRLCQQEGELEIELETERRRLADASKSYRKAVRGIQEYKLRTEEGRKAGERLANLVDKLQQQVGSYKKQIEEAEEISTINLCKYRRVEGELLGAEDRAGMRESVLSRMRGRAVSEERWPRATSLPPF